MNFTLSPHLVQLLQDTSRATGYSMSAMVEIAVEYMIEGGHVQGAHAFVLERRLQVMQETFEMAKRDKEARGHPVQADEEDPLG